VRKFQQAVAMAVFEPDLEQRLAAEAAEPVASTPADFAAFLRTDIARWTRVVREAHIQVD
jgi:tripartite-type tricarboxylate transporter receptor subunit TctC